VEVFAVEGNNDQSRFDRMSEMDMASASFHLEPSVSFQDADDL
jgi:hypothetical protein